MIGLEVERALQGRFPLLQSLARQPEHQIEVEIFETTPAQQPKSRLRLSGGMIPAEELEQSIVEGLHPEADPIHARLAQEARFPFRHAAGIGFKGPFLEERQIEPL